MRAVIGTLLVLFLWQMDGLLCAQELTLSGVGPINHSLAGVAVALPRDSAGAMQWNPATISFLDHSEFQLGLGRHNAPWYGDEYAAGTAGVALLAVAWLYLVSTSDDSESDLWSWERTDKRGNHYHIYLIPEIIIGSSDYDTSRPRPVPREETQSSERGPHLPVVRVPTISYLYQRPYSRWSFGLAISEYGARKVGAVAVGDIVGIGVYRFQGYEFIPTFAYRESRRFSMGISPIFSIDETPNATFPVILSRYSGASQDKRSRAGVGAQIGMYYQPNQRIRFGASVRTPQLIDGYTYRWADPRTGKINSQHLAFSQDSSFRIALGTSYALRNDKTTIASDFRYDDYSHASALYDIPASFDSAVKKQGIARAAYTWALGVEYRPRDIIAFRAGYQWTHAESPSKSVIYNTSLPVQSGHSIHYGTTFFFSESFDISLSISNAFGGGWETLATEEGSIRFRRNPNRSNFWIAARLRF